MSPESQGKVRIAFAGVGYMGQVAHLRNYAFRDDCEVVAIAEPRPELARKVADAFGVPTLYSDHLDLLNDPNIDAVVASQPHLRNGHIAVPLLQAGKYVFTEKPMAGSLEEAQEIQAAAEKGGVHLMVGVMKRYDPAVLAALDALQGFYANGELGRLQRVRAHCWGGDWIQNAIAPIATSETVPNDPTFEPHFAPWMDLDQAKQFQNYTNIMAHTVNLVRYLYPQPLTVQTALARQENRLLHTVLLDSPQGALVELAGGGTRSHQWEEETHFYFERGWVKLYTPSPLNRQGRGRVEIYHSEDSKSGELREIIPPIGWAFQRQADHFIECVRERKEPTSSGRDTLEDMRLMEDIFRKMILV
jgi:predicted dehydrogenase